MTHIIIYSKEIQWRKKCKKQKNRSYEIYLCFYIVDFTYNWKCLHCKTFYAHDKDQYTLVIQEQHNVKCAIRAGCGVHIKDAKKSEWLKNTWKMLCPNQNICPHFYVSKQAFNTVYVGLISIEASISYYL